MEIWKPVKGFAVYEVSNRGRIRSLDKSVLSGIKHNTHTIKYGRTLKQSLKRSGYFAVMLYTSESRKTMSVHRLVAKMFLANPDNKPHVNHVNGVKTDNRSNNLEWCTPVENMQHAWRTGLKQPPTHRKEILCVETKIVYPSSTQAAEQINRVKFKNSKDTQGMARKIRASATGKQQTAYGYHWKDIKDT